MTGLFTSWSVLSLVEEVIVALLNFTYLTWDKHELDEYLDDEIQEGLLISAWTEMDPRRLSLPRYQDDRCIKCPETHSRCMFRADI